MSDTVAATPEAESGMISVPAAAKLLGISRDLAYRLAREDRLGVPVVKFSPKCWRVSRVMVDRLVATGVPIKSVASCAPPRTIEERVAATEQELAALRMTAL